VSGDHPLAWPLQLRVKKQARVLSVEFDDGQTFEISFELLRVESPSAQVQGHRPSEKKIVPDKADVSIERVEPVGRYGVRLVFDDGHDSGIYTWGWLYQLGREGEAMLAAYHSALSQTKPQLY
jgi:DUF971 family protein